MRRFVFACLIAACAALAPTLASAGDQEIDKEIAQHIVQKLSQAQKEGQLKSFDLDLHVDKGVVWLKGYVASDAQKQFVLETAKSGKSLGLQQIVDDIEVRAAEPTPAARPQQEQQLLAAAPAPSTSSRRQGENTPLASPVQDQQVQTVQHQQVQPAPAQPVLTQPAPAQPAPVQPAAVQTVAVQPTPAQAAPAQAAPAQQVQVQQVQLQEYQLPQQQAQVAPARQIARPVAMPRSSTPLASAPAYGGYQGMPQGGAPAYIPASQSQPPGAYYDQPSMPGYAWPSYAAHPNYSAVTYPTQYSPTAWPYIGPFYPYPQVPLGWRKVTMEWDDGWWYLDFCER